MSQSPGAGSGGETIDIVILAAGESRRFGGVKALAHYGGVPLVQRALDNSRGHGGASVSLVLGAHREEILQQIRPGGVRLLNNPHWRSGMASSIRCAVENAGEEAAAILFLAMDQVLLERADIAALLALCRENPDRIVAAYYNGQAGIPALFPRSHWPALLRLRGDRGARAILRDNPQVIGYPLAVAGADIDTREQLERLSASGGHSPHNRG